jgi:REP element-mobilizing transposase RayT
MLTPHFSSLDAAYQLHFYLCFKTRYLQPVFVTEDRHELVSRVLEEVCAREQYHLLTCDVSPTYLRLLLSLQPQHVISQVAKMLKGNLSCEFNTSFGPQQNSIWARGYFARSSGKVSLARAQAYVEAQASHHGYQGEWIKPLSYRNRTFESPVFRLDHCLCMLDYHLVLTTSHRISLFDEAIALQLYSATSKTSAASTDL